MPSNYTIAKTLQRVACYREICGRDSGKYPGAAMEAQSLAGQRLDALEDPTDEQLKTFLNEADTEVLETVREILQGAEITALRPGSVPLTILEITEIKGLGPKMARRVHEELGVVDLCGLKEALDSGSLAKVKGFGPKVSAKIADHVEKREKKAKSS